MMAALSRFIADLNGTKSTGGSSNAYTVAAANIDHTALSNGLMISVRASFTNTGASTFNLNSIGAKKIKKFKNVGGTVSESDLSAGDIGQNGHYVLQYDTSLDSAAGAWVLINPTVDVNAGITGEIRAYASGPASPPAGWLWCDGSGVSRTTYANLFAAISTQYGGGDGFTSFNVPDLRGRTIVGKDDIGGSGIGRVTIGLSGIAGTVLGATGGTETVTLTTANLASHSHSGSASTVGDHSHGGLTGLAGAHDHGGATGGQSATHTHAASTSAETTTHTHGVSGATGGQSVGHAHTASTAAETTTHSHTISISDPGHFHDGGDLFDARSTGGIAAAAGGVTYVSDVNNSGAGNTSSKTTGITASAGNNSATHTHVVTVDAVTTDHTHTISLTSGANSATHTHAVTVAAVSTDHTHSISAASDHQHTIGGDGAHGHTITIGSAGSGTPHSNMQPSMMLNYIIRT